MHVIFAQIITSTIEKRKEKDVYCTAMVKLDENIFPPSLTSPFLPFPYFQNRSIDAATAGMAVRNFHRSKLGQSQSARHTAYRAQ